MASLNYLESALAGAFFLIKMIEFHLDVSPSITINSVFIKYDDKHQNE